MLSRRMLSKEDEGNLSLDETEVRREDQEKINRFSRLHAREAILEEVLQQKNKDKEDLEEVSGELELADEDERLNYKVGDSFVLLPQPAAQKMLWQSMETINEELRAVESRLESVREEMRSLKVDLYATFGRIINLET